MLSLVLASTLTQLLLDVRWLRRAPPRALWAVKAHALLAAGLALPVSALWLFHCYLGVTRQTTYEFITASHWFSRRSPPREAGEHTLALPDSVPSSPEVRRLTSALSGLALDGLASPKSQSHLCAAAILPSPDDGEPGLILDGAVSLNGNSRLCSDGESSQSGDS
mmetsp:Transcript_20689/g.36436  ORF Transcript_20689/g.36436 Transcript_20689/m.36436 type:complete len:165 (-) Transcript_20689:111-605(-)